jgi:CBS domain-containing protein
MAIVGPLSSLLLAGLFWGAAQVGSSLGPAVTGVLLYLATINVVLAVFNLIPGFPLDGGRVLRAVLWGLTKNLRRATRIASQVGAGFGILLIAWGALTTLRGNVMGGVWFFLIGMFLRNAAQLSYRQLVVRRALEGEPVHRFMQPRPVTVTPDLGIDRLVDDYVYRYLYKMYPVVDSEGVLRGCISTRHIKDLPRQDWPARRVGELMEPCTSDNSVSPLSDAMQALTLMNRTKTSRLLVVDGGRLMGVLALKDLLRFLSLKMDLEENDRRPPPQGRGDSAAPAAPGAWRA